jgi:glutamate synthase (NADPH/NADH) large chain
VQLEALLAENEQESKLPPEIWHLGRADEAIVKGLLNNHARYTGSAQAAQILEHWGESRQKFVKVFPNEYRRALGELAAKGKKLAA